MFPSQKKLLVNSNFAIMIFHVMTSMKNNGEVYVSSNNLVAHNGFATAKMVTYTFQKFLHWKRGFP